MREILQNIRSELGIPEDDRLDNSFGFAPAGSGATALSNPTRFDLEDSGRRRVSYSNDLEVEESHLAICHVRPSKDDGYEVTDLTRQPALGAPAWESMEASMDVTPPQVLSSSQSREERARKEVLEVKDVEEKEVLEVEDMEEKKEEIVERSTEKVERGGEDLLTTQDESDLAMMQETLMSAIERQASHESQEGKDVTDASPEKGEFEKNWTRNGKPLVADILIKKISLRLKGYWDLPFFHLQSNQRVNFHP